MKFLKSREARRILSEQLGMDVRPDHMRILHVLRLGPPMVRQNRAGGPYLYLADEFYEWMEQQLQRQPILGLDNQRLAGECKVDATNDRPPSDCEVETTDDQPRAAARGST